MNQYFRRDLIEKYSQNAPRYTSYPTAVEFNADFGEQQHISYLKNSNKALSLYLHIPFCAHVCYYCGCNKIITSNQQQVHEYLDYLEKEIQLQIKHLPENLPPVVQLHFGGGTPTFLKRPDMERVFAILHRYFKFAPDDVGEFSIEIDPRTVSASELQFLRSLGFNRVSFGVQDFNPDVQAAVNRIQPYEEVEMTVLAAREAKFHSISADLIYGLPRQTSKTFARTIEQIIQLQTDRLAIFHYAHMPHIFGAQRQINPQDLPNSEEKINMLEHSIYALTQNDYEFIGLDHFAKKDDSLVKHQQAGTLYRNFQGYSTFANCDVLAFGISSISMIGDSYSQNEKARSRYYERLQRDEIPILRGFALNADDVLRRHVITEIMCNLHLDLDEVSKRFKIDAAEYFANEWTQLPEFAEDGLISLQNKRFDICDLGRLFIRNIAYIFDKYSRQHSQNKFSKTL